MSVLVSTPNHIPFNKGGQIIAMLDFGMSTLSEEARINPRKLWS